MLHPHRQYALWSEDYIGDGNPPFVAPTTPQEALEVGLESRPVLSDFEGHPGELWDQLLPLDGLRRVQWRGMKTLFRSFAMAFLGHENEWRTVQTAVQTLWARAMDVRHALVHGSGQINEVARRRRLLYERLDASTRRQGERGRLLDQLFDWRVEGTMEMVQLLADAFDVEILVHIPHIPPPDEGVPVGWKVLSRGIPSSRGQINLVNYSSINRWTVVRNTSYEGTPRVFNYTAHLTIDRTNYFHRRPVLEDPLLPSALPRDDSSADDHRPNYILEMPNRNGAPSDQTQHRDPSEDLYVTGGTDRLTTTDDYLLIQMVRREAEELENMHRRPNTAAENTHRRTNTAAMLRDPSSSQISEIQDIGRSLERGLQDRVRHGILRERQLSLSNNAQLQGLRFHPEIIFRQYRTRGTGGTCLLRAFAQAYFGTQTAWRRVSRDAERIIGLAGLIPDAQHDPEIQLSRNHLYDRLDDESRRSGWGSLLQQARGQEFGTDALVQVLADVYGVEIFMHSPSIDFNRPQDNIWSLIIRGDSRPTRDGQVHLVNYPALQHWNCLRARSGARYTDHQAVRGDERLQLRGNFVENRLEIAPRLQRVEGRSGRGPNYQLSAGTVVDDDESSSSSSSTFRHSKRRRSDSDSGSSSPPNNSKRQRSSSQSSSNDDCDLPVPPGILVDPASFALAMHKMAEIPIDEGGLGNTLDRISRSPYPDLSAMFRGLTPEVEAIRMREFDNTLQRMIRDHILETVEDYRASQNATPALAGALEHVLRERWGLRDLPAVDSDFGPPPDDTGGNLTPLERLWMRIRVAIYERVIQGRMDEAMGVRREREELGRLLEYRVEELVRQIRELPEYGERIERPQPQRRLAGMTADDQGDDSEDSEETSSSSLSSDSQDVGPTQESDDSLPLVQPLPPSPSFPALSPPLSPSHSSSSLRLSPASPYVGAETAPETQQTDESESDDSESDDSGSDESESDDSESQHTHQRTAPGASPTYGSSQPARETPETQSSQRTSHATDPSEDEEGAVLLELLTERGRGGSSRANWRGRGRGRARGRGRGGRGRGRGGR